MRFSIWPNPAQPWDDIYEITSHCERTGWDGVYFADHFMPNGPGPEPLDGDILECWSIMPALAATVPRLRLAPLVTSVTYRHPAVLANIAAAGDQGSHGRLTLGIGAGWQGDEDGGRGLAGERARRVRDHRGDGARAAGPVRGGRAGPAFPARRAQDHVFGPVLPARRRAEPACPGPEPDAAADRGRGRAAHDAHRGPVRRRVERLDHAGTARAQGLGAARALRAGRPGPR